VAKLAAGDVVAQGEASALLERFKAARGEVTP
jgi:hypothetical protein